MIVELHKAFSHIKYYDDTHKYIDTKTGKELISVTSSLKKYQKPFDSEYWSKRKAKELNVDQSEILREWNDKAIYGRLRGSFTHLLAEDRAANKVFKRQIPKEIYDLDKVDDFKAEQIILRDQVNNLFTDIEITPIRKEMIVGDDIYAGQIDLLCYWNGKICIADFKTDKEIKVSNKYQKLKAPYNDMDDCNFSKYSLQLNKYRSLIENNTTIKIEQLKIVHLCSTNDNYQVYDIPFINIK